MKKYMVIYLAPEELMAQTGNASPEEMEEGMKQWMAWAARCGDQLLDLGNPLTGGHKVLADGSSQKSTHGVGGYSILQAENMDDVKSLLTGHPHLAWNEACEIEIHEFRPLPGQ